MDTGPINLNDPEGEEVLRIISKAGRFNRWMYQAIKPFVSGKILEVGSGIGNISGFFLKDNHQITLSDIRPQYVEALKQKFQTLLNPDSALMINLADPEFERNYASQKGYFDTVFALNVVEHIENDSQAVKNCRYLLREGGNLILLVPAYQWLFCRFDINLGHFRRYTRKSLSQIMKNSGFEIIHSRYFNLAGIAGWLLSGKIMRKKTIPEGQMGFFNMLVPLFRIADQIVMNRAGLSVLAIGKKN